ncbi:MAG: ABC transporter ATP-binding protein [Cellulomonadaceae bacterium]
MSENTHSQQPDEADAAAPAASSADAQPTSTAPARLPKEAAAHHGPGGGGMGMPAEKPLDLKGSTKRFLSYLRPFRVRVALILAFGVASVALAVSGPRLLGHATDVIFDGVVGKLIGQEMPAGTTAAQAVEALRANGQDQLADMIAGMDGIVPGAGIDFTALRNVILAIVAVYVASFFFAWVQNRITAYVVQRTIYRMRQEIEDKLARLPLSYFDRNQRGEVLSRVTNDVDNVSQTLTQVLAQLITSALTIIGVLAMMFWISWILALVALVTVPLAVWVTAKIAKRSQPQFIRQWSSTGRLNAQVEEMYTGHALVKVYGHQEQAIEEFVTENDQLYEASFKSQFISGTIQPVMGLVGNLNYVIVAVVGGLQVAAGSLSLGSVQAFIQYSRQFTQPISQIASMMNLVQSGVASAERVFDLLDATEQTPDPADAEVLTDVRGEVAFEDVSFRYEPQTPLIEHLNLTAKPGRTVAIVGPTGAGKTTLVNLLLRFYEVDGGRITLDGVDTRRMTRANLRENIGMVLQDTWLFRGTIEENIRYGRPDASHEELLEAAKATYVDRFVRTLPDGYDTVLEDDAANLSAGEKQLMTIARAFLADPTILVLDEATSSVDTRTEVLVQHAMNALREGRTSFVIAHRLSTIRDADVIVVMEHGQIVEQGTHDELVAHDGPYRRLYQSQFSSAVEAAVED